MSKITQTLIRYVLLAFCFINVTALQKEYQQIIDQVAANDMGSTIIQEIQVELNSEKGDRGLAELVVLFNLMEKNLVQEEQEDSEKLQENAEKLRNQKQEIQDAIAESQYAVSMLGEQIVQINEARGHYAARLDEKEYLHSEYAKLVEQLESIRQEESDRYNSNRDEILNTVDIVKRAKYLISQLSPKMPKNKVLAQQSLQQPDDQAATQKKLEQLHRESVDQLGEENPYVKIIGSLVQVTASPKKEEVESMVAILTHLYDDLMDTNTNLYQAETERADNFDSVKERCESEMAAWEQEMADINKQIEDDKQVQNDLDVRRGQKATGLENLQRELDDVQTLLEDDQIGYNQRKKDREEYLKLLRKLKAVLQADFDGAKQYILQKLTQS